MPFLLVLERDNLKRERGFEGLFFFFFLYREMRMKEKEEREKAKSRKERKSCRWYVCIGEMKELLTLVSEKRCW